MPGSDPRRRFLINFYKFFFECVGREITYIGHEEEAIDLEWSSKTLEHTMRFSYVAYIIVSHGCRILDHWNGKLSPADASKVEAEVIEELSNLRSWLKEGRIAAEKNSNAEVLAMIEQADSLLDILDECLQSQ